MKRLRGNLFTDAKKMYQAFRPLIWVKYINQWTKCLAHFFASEVIIMYYFLRYFSIFSPLFLLISTLTCFPTPLLSFWINILTIHIFSFSLIPSTAVYLASDSLSWWIMTRFVWVSKQVQCPAGRYFINLFQRQCLYLHYSVGHFESKWCRKMANMLWYHFSSKCS